MSMGKKFRVMVLAMSTLPDPTKTNASGHSAFDYRYIFSEKNPDGKGDSKEYHGIGQLESVPQYIFDEFGAITHFIILQTKKVTDPLPYNWKEIDGKITGEGDGASIGAVNENLSAVDFFERRINAFREKKLEEKMDSGVEDSGFDIEPEFISIEYSESEPDVGLSKLLACIRDLYAKCQQDNDGKDIDECWQLFIDVHGGYRAAALAMFALIQTLSAPDEQDLMSGKDANLDAAIARLTDGKGTVPISGVYTVNFNPSEKYNAIVEKTKFYQLFTRESLIAYMNYGQYAQLALSSKVKDPEKSAPYAFISYRRMDAPKERFAFLGVLKKEGYRYWYDDAIELQSDWQEQLEKANSFSTVFVALITKHYYESGQCLKELKEAIENNKTILFVSLDDTPLYNMDHDLSADIKEKTFDEKGNVIEKTVTVTISQDALQPILNKQHMQLKDLLQNGVFQHEVLKKKLDELCEADGKFRSIKED